MSRMTPGNTSNDGADDLSRVRELSERAEHGDGSALAELQRLLDGRTRLWRHYGDIGRQARGAWIRLAAGDDVLLRESLIRQADAYYRELAGSRPPLVVRMLAEHVVVCWLQAGYADSLYACLPADSPLKVRRYVEERQRQATHRLHYAVAQLVKTKGLLDAQRAALRGRRRRVATDPVGRRRGGPKTPLGKLRAWCGSGGRPHSGTASGDSQGD